MVSINTNIDNLSKEGLAMAVNYGLNRTVEIKSILSIHPLFGHGDQNAWVYETYVTGNANRVNFLVSYNSKTLRLEADILR